MWTADIISFSDVEKTCGGIWESTLSGAGGFKIAVLLSKTNFDKGNSSNFESSLPANCEGLHKWLGSRSAKGKEAETRSPIAEDLEPRLGKTNALFIS